MLQFTHQDQTIEVDVENLPLHEGLALQKATGKRLPEFLKAIEAVDMEALAALGWVLIKFRMGQEEATFDDVCTGKVPISIKSFANSEAQPETPPEGNGQVPRRGARAKTRTSGATAT